MLPPHLSCIPGPTLGGLALLQLRKVRCVRPQSRLKVLMADMSINCRSERYRLTPIFTWIMVAIYPIGIPAARFATLFWYRKRINPTTTSDSMDEKISKRDDDRYLDRLVPLRRIRAALLVVRRRGAIRRLYLTGLLAFFGSDEEPLITTHRPRLLGAMVYYIVMAHFEPYVDDSDDLLAKVAAVQVIFMFFGATMLQARSNSDDEEAGDLGVFQGAIFAAICVIVGLFTSRWLSTSSSLNFQYLRSPSGIGKPMWGEFCHSGARPIT